MVFETSYTRARANLAKLCQRVTADRDVVVITRRGGDDVALISADELSGLLETAHLLRSPKNAARLSAALERSRADEGQPQSIEELLAEVAPSEPKAAAKSRR